MYINHGVHGSVQGDYRSAASGDSSWCRCCLRECHRHDIHFRVNAAHGAQARNRSEQQHRKHGQAEIDEERAVLAAPQRPASCIADDLPVLLALTSLDPASARARHTPSAPLRKTHLAK
jgi:hypothetical protein